MISIKIVRVSNFTETPVVSTSAMRSKVRAKQKVSTFERAETWPAALMGRADLEGKRASDLHNNCES